jgi:XTP/dITP diphosphohydrolase
VSRRRFVLATGNPGKAAEIDALLAAAGVEVVPQSAFGLAPAGEHGTTFVENAIAKARHAARGSGLPALADDSGLVVDALGGEPGVHSSRYAGPGADDAANNARLLKALKGVAPRERSARFVCVVVLMRHPGDPLPVVCEGVWEGTILPAPRGSGGFGYDPIFHYPPYGATLAEVPAEAKLAVAHRGRAFRALAAWLGRGRPTDRAAR